LPVRTPFFPLIQIAGLALLCAVLVTMGLDKETWRISWIVGVPWLALVSAAYFILKARGGLAASVASAASAASASVAEEPGA
jgi:L-asparagine transporter-like permease